MNTLKIIHSNDEVVVTRLDKSQISFITLSDLIDVAIKDCLTYEPDIYENGESLTIKCYTLEDALQLFKRIKQECRQYISNEEEQVETKLPETVQDLDDEGPKEELPQA